MNQQSPVKNYLIIGASAASVSVITTLRRLEPSAKITCFADQLVDPYNKCHLVDYCMNLKTRQELSILSNDHRQAIDLRLGLRVTKIQAQEKQVELSD